MTVDSNDGRTAYEIIERGIFVIEGLEFYTVMVDGDMARELLVAFNVAPQLGKDATNRKLSQVRVQAYAQEIRNGEWYFNPQPVVLSAPNKHNLEELSDGQHRLAAVVLVADEKPDLRVPLTICIGAPLDAKKVMDLGKAKSPGDFLAMQGVANPSRTASAIRMLYSYNETQFRSIQVWRSQKLSNPRQQAYLADHPRLVEGMRKGMSMATQVNPGVIAVFYEIMAKEHDVFVANTFLEGLKLGVMEGVTLHDARWKLREYLAQQKAANYRWDGYEQLALLILAANDWLLKSDSFRPSIALARLKNPAHKSPVFPRILERSKLPQASTLL